MRRLVLPAVFLLSLASACGGGQPALEADVGLAPEQRIRRGLELAEQRDYEGALAEFRAAQREQPTAAGSLRIANANFKLGHYESALVGYRAYLEKRPEMPVDERQAVLWEIERTEKALQKDEEPGGRSLAGQWFRGELARLRAGEALAEERWADARREYDQAYQYLGYAELLFESALAATREGDLRAALGKYEEYLANAMGGVAPQREYAVGAEIDRLQAILDGEQPVTEESLADRVYAERSGVEEPEGPPPSVELGAGAGPVEPEPEPEPEAEVEVEAEPEPDPDPEPRPAADIKESPYGVASPPKPRPEPEPEPEVAQTEKEEKAGYRRLSPEKTPSERRKEPVRVEREPATIEDLLFYAGSRSSSVRYRAVRDLIPIPGERARRALVERMTEDTNLQVRIAAIRGLAARRSSRSIPAMRRALITAATSQERAVLKDAISEIQESFK
ncbi:MAG: HEAT repeat domain-containing protein [Polyangia bacterium]